MANLDELALNIQGTEGRITSMAESVEFTSETHDHRTLSSSYTHQDDFLPVETAGEYHGDEASVTLAQCKKYVVRPYNVLLKVIGWRRFQSSKEKIPGYINCLNIVYPAFIFVMLASACLAQVFTCFHRSISTPPDKVSEDYYVLSCKRHLVTYDVISYLMILTSYVLALYTFRVAEPEHLSSLTERVFLSFNDVILSKSRRKPFFILLTILGCGVVFVLISVVISITRLFSLMLDDTNTIIAWFSSNITAEDQSEVLKISGDAYRAVHFFLVVIALLGFLFFDLLFITVTINYCSQCQLLKYYIENILVKVRNKKYENLNIASKEIYRVYEFLKILNGNISIVASLVFFVFLSNVMLSYNDLIKPDQEPLNVVTGFLNTIQWLVAAIFPVLFATRFTASGNELRRLGIEIASRPFYYSSTSDLELQFFLNFTESTRYQVNLAFIPMQPSLVLGFGFVVLLFLSSGVVISQVESVKWF